ncbi:MAG: helix-turn-helix transcriptional regulator [Phycisphaeraceae bacterium]|nr:helix-turn-helix transcriptional regulator [Phycisphaeraceae bacterium]
MPTKHLLQTMPAEIDRKTFTRMAQGYLQRWPLRLCVVQINGQRRLSKNWWSRRDTAQHQELLAFNVQEGLRYGEPTATYCPDNRLYWAVPLMHNAQLLGGIVAGIDDDQLFPQGTENPPLDLKLACRELRLIVERENLTNAALLARHRVDTQRESERAQVLHLLKLDGVGSVRQLYLNEEPRLLAVVRQGDRGEARLILNRILTVILHHAGDRFDLVKSFMMELVATVCRTAVEVGADPEAMLGHNFQSMTALASIRSLEQMAPWLHEMLEKTMDAMAAQPQNTSSVMIADAITYMQQHLCDPIGRDDVANAVALSPSHFSRLFKQHVGRGFNQTLVRMRVDHAAELLARTSLPIGQIAQESGFTEQGYFSKTFHWLIGKSPSAYRQSHTVA